MIFSVIIEGGVLFIVMAIVVFFTRYLNDRNQKMNRKIDIFRSLVRARDLPLDSDFVNAINLIEVEFMKDKEVIIARKEYVDSLTALKSSRRMVNDAKSRTFLVKLIHEISKTVKMEIGISDFPDNYVPQKIIDDNVGHQVVLWEQAAVLSGRKALRVEIQSDPQDGDSSSSPASPYPPPPENI